MEFRSETEKLKWHYLFKKSLKADTMFLSTLFNFFLLLSLRNIKLPFPVLYVITHNETMGMGLKRALPNPKIQGSTPRQGPSKLGIYNQNLTHIHLYERYFHICGSSYLWSWKSNFKNSNQMVKLIKEIGILRIFTEFFHKGKNYFETKSSPFHAFMNFIYLGLYKAE